MSDNRPIGIFDSGIGGLSVMQEIRSLLPYESILYFADTGNCPYGPRNLVEIQGLASNASGFLVSKGAKLIVVACNTASVASLAFLRNTYAVPFIGMVPAVKPAATNSRTRKVGVMATNATLQGEMFDQLVQKFASDVMIVRQVCPGLVPAVEQGKIDDPKTKELLLDYIQPLLDADVDTVVLGCTHYVFLKTQIEDLLGPNIVVIDSGYAVARQTARVLQDRDIASEKTKPRSPVFYTTGDVEQVKGIISRLTAEADLNVIGVPHLRKPFSPATEESEANRDN